MAINLDMDVGQIFKNFLNKKGKSSESKKEAEKPSLSKAYYKQSGVKCILVICITAIISWGINYLTTSSGRDESEFLTLDDVKAAVVKIEQDIASSRQLLEKNRKNVEEILPMFSDMEGSKTMFKLISNIAAQNGMVIKNLSQGTITETTTPAKFLQTNVLLEMEGFYPDYMNFKKELVKQKDILRIDSEVIKLTFGNNGERKINISVNFIDYSIEKQEYEKVLQK